jgi:hypothetical protein
MANNKQGAPGIGETPHPPLDPQILIVELERIARHVPADLPFDQYGQWTASRQRDAIRLAMAGLPFAAPIDWKPRVDPQRGNVTEWRCGREQAVSHDARDQFAGVVSPHASQKVEGTNDDYSDARIPTDPPVDSLTAATVATIPSDDDVTTIRWGRLRELFDAEGERVLYDTMREAYMESANRRVDKAEAERAALQQRAAALTRERECEICRDCDAVRGTVATICTEHYRRAVQGEADAEGEADDAKAVLTQLREGLQTLINKWNGDDAASTIEECVDELTALLAATDGVHDI